MHVDEEFALPRIATTGTRVIPVLDMSLSDTNMIRTQTTRPIQFTHGLLAYWDSALENSDSLCVLLLKTREDWYAESAVVPLKIVQFVGLVMYVQAWGVSNLVDPRIKDTNVDGQYQVDLHPCGSLSCCSQPAYSLWFSDNWLWNCFTQSSNCEHWPCIKQLFRQLFLDWTRDGKRAGISFTNIVTQSTAGLGQSIGIGLLVHEDISQLK